ncbi:hypothetical protein BDR05DRAFT_957278, partial [Suillus weaverae]
TPVDAHCPPTTCRKRASVCGLLTIGNASVAWDPLFCFEGPYVHQSTKAQTFHCTSLILCRPRRVCNDKVSTGASSLEYMSLQARAAVQPHQGSKCRNNVIFEEHDRELWQRYPLETAASDLQHKRAADILQLNVVQ